MRASVGDSKLEVGGKVRRVDYWGRRGKVNGRGFLEKLADVVHRYKGGGRGGDHNDREHVACVSRQLVFFFKVNMKRDARDLRAWSFGSL